MDSRTIYTKTANPKTANPKTANPKTADPKTADPRTANPESANPEAANTDSPEFPGTFTSDNTAGASAEVYQAIAECGLEQAQPYGADRHTQAVEQRLKEIFECDLSAFLVPTGSAANGLCLASMTPPWGNIYCHRDSHINNDECGAPAFFSAGAKLIALDGDNAKIDPDQLEFELGIKVGDVHSTQPACVSVTQATETGSLYSLDELQRIGALCRDNHVRLHMDGARFSNALVSLNCSPAEMTWKAGVHALSFGATKNGVLAAEAIVLFDRQLESELAYRRKRGGHLLSKMRFLSCQLEAYLDNDLWLHNARHANAMAARLSAGLKQIDGVEMLGETEANIIFCNLAPSAIERLLEMGYRFYHDRWGPGVVRLVTSYATADEEVDRFVTAVRQLHL